MSIEWQVGQRAINPDGTVTLEFEDFLRLLSNRPTPATAAQLADASAFINISNKFQSKLAYDTTNDILYWAVGNATTDNWKSYAGTITPS